MVGDSFQQECVDTTREHGYAHVSATKSLSSPQDLTCSHGEAVRLLVIAKEFEPTNPLNPQNVHANSKRVAVNV